MTSTEITYKLNRRRGIWEARKDGFRGVGEDKGEAFKSLMFRISEAAKPAPYVPTAAEWEAFLAAERAGA